MDESQMTPEQALARLQAECKRRGRKSELARLSGLSRSYIGRMASGARPVTDEACSALVAAWSKEAGPAALHAVPSLPPVPRAHGPLAQALAIRAGEWSRRTVTALREIEAVASAHKVRCSAGQWLDIGDQLERDGRASGLIGTKK